MPKATIHKDRKFPRSEEEIWLSGKPHRPNLPSLCASPDQAKPQAPLCRPIARSSDRLHRPRPLGRRPLELSTGQVSPKRPFHRSNALVVKSRHCRGKPEQLFLREILAYPFRQTVPGELQLCKRPRELL